MKHNLIAIAVAGIFASGAAHADDSNFVREKDRLTGREAAYLSHQARDGNVCIDTKLEVLLDLVWLEALSYDCASGEPLAFRVPSFGTEFVSRALINDLEVPLGFALAGYPSVAKGAVPSPPNVGRLRTIKVLFELASGEDALVEYRFDDPLFQDYVRPLLGFLQRPDYFSEEGLEVLADRTNAQHDEEQLQASAQVRENEAAAIAVAEARKNPKPLLDQLAAQIRQCVTPPSGSEGMTATARITLDADGLVRDAEVLGIADSPVNDAFRRAVLRALNRCGPYLNDPLLADFYHDLEVTIAAD